MGSRVSAPSEAIAEICQRYHVRRMSFFGSVLRDDFGPESDVDVLVEFVPDRTPGFFTIARLERELSALFEERQVDVRTPEDLSRYFRAEVVASAEILYEAA